MKPRSCRTLPASPGSIAILAFPARDALSHFLAQHTCLSTALGCAARLLSLMLLLTLPAVVQAQFNYTTNDGAITITGYTGPGGAVTIPSTINGLPVTRIGSSAFKSNTLTSVTIPNSVTFIFTGTFAFGCTSLTAITVDALNSAYSSVDGVLFDKIQTTLIQYPVGKAGSYTIPNSVTIIGSSAFSECTNLTSVTIGNSVTHIAFAAFIGCSSLTSVTIPNSVTRIGFWAFVDCTGLTGVYFEGDALSFDSSEFEGADKVTVYYLPGTTGWGTTFAGRPTALWLPEARTADADFGVRTNQFGFNIRWASDKVVVVEAFPDLSNPVWTPVSTNTLTGGSSYFSDPQWTNHPTGFYRLRSQ